MGRRLSLENLKKLDVHYSSRLQKLSAAGPVKLVLSLLAHSGDAFVVLPILFLLWWLGDSGLKSLALTLGIGIVVSLSLIYIIKFSVRRSRPPGDWGKFYRMTDPYSFPSGHAAKTMTLAVIFLGCHSVWSGALIFLWAIMVGFSRIALGVHYLSDITVGYLIGLLGGTAVCVFTLMGGFPG